MQLREESPLSSNLQKTHKRGSLLNPKSHHPDDILHLLQQTLVSFKGDFKPKVPWLSKKKGSLNCWSLDL